MQELLRYVVIRFGSALLTLIGVSLVVFISVHLLPGSFEEVLAPRGSPELRARIAEKFGLDQPYLIQFFQWLKALTQGDLGISLITQSPISDSFAVRIPVTLELAGLATITSLIIGVPLGLWSGVVHANRKVSSIGRFAGSMLMSVPDFVYASLFLYIFSRFSLGITVGQWVSPSENFLGHIQAVILPVLTLSALGIGMFMSTTRTAVISVLSQDYIMAAIARGKSPIKIIKEHILRNISIPLITMLTIYAGYLVGGAIIVEVLYSIPGIGRFLIQGVLNRDYPVVQAGVLVIACATVMLNLFADIMYAVIDPRIRRS